jgi:hypothetical protein
MAVSIVLKIIVYIVILYNILKIGYTNLFKYEEFLKKVIV